MKNKPHIQEGLQPEKRHSALPSYLSVKLYNALHKIFIPFWHIQICINYYVCKFFLFLIFLRTTGNTIFHHVLNINANWWTCSCGLYHQIRRQTKIWSTLQTKYQLFAFPSLHAGIVYTCWPAFVEPFKPSVFQWLA